MTEEVLHRRDNVLVRRLILQPGDTTHWHSDVCHRVTVVLKGSELSIEFRDGSGAKQVKVTAGQVDWDTPSDRGHRAVNVGTTTYEEVTIFFLSEPQAIPQTSAE